MKRFFLPRGLRAILSISLGLFLGLSGNHSMAETKSRNNALIWDVTLNQEQTVPPISTRAHGSAMITLNADQTELGFRLTVSDIVDITKAHIHVGRAGKKGPHIFVLSAISFESPLVGSLKETDLAPQAKQGIATFKDAVDAIMDGRAYINVHTLGHPSEEIRGQIIRK